MAGGRTAFGKADPTGCACAPRGTSPIVRRREAQQVVASGSAGRSGGPAVALLSTADWNRPLWTNKQHLAVQLASHGLAVTYVDSLGFRRPRMALGDVRRITEKVGAITGRGGGGRPVPAGMEVVRPVVLPVHRSTWPSWPWNRGQVRRAVRRWTAVERNRRVLWTFSPITYDLEEDAAVTVYHCVDLLEEVAGYDRRAIREGELRLARRGATAIASSSVVRDHLERLGFSDVRLWENVADTDVIATAAGAEEPVSGHVVFAGNLTTDKVDVDLLEGVARAPGVHLHLAGPVAEGGGARRPWARLLGLPRVHHHGVLLPEQLGALLGRCAVGLIPYRLNSYTRGVFPMKLYEYLSAGLAVVSTDLPSLPRHRHLTIARGQEAFVDALREQVLASSPEVVRARRDEGSHPSWRARGQQAVELLEVLVGAGPSGTSR